MRHLLASVALTVLMVSTASAAEIVEKNTTTTTVTTPAQAPTPKPASEEVEITVSPGPTITPDLTPPPPPPAAEAPVVSPNRDVVAQPPPAPGKDVKEVAVPPSLPPAPSSDVKCDTVELLNPGKEAAKFWISMFDDGRDPDFVRKMEACSGDRVKQRPDSEFKDWSVDVRVVSDEKGWALVKVPSERRKFLFVRFHPISPKFKDAPHWKSALFGDKEKIELAQTTPVKVIGKRD